MPNPRWRTIWRYLGAILLGNLVWEMAQLPLYTIWKTGTARELAVAVLHCTAGDVAIAASALGIAIVLTREWNWPRSEFRKVACVAIVIGIAYTIYSERLNVLVLQNWSYADLMPVLPWLEVGLSPVLQWLLVPAVAFGWVQKEEMMAAAADPARRTGRGWRA